MSGGARLSLQQGQKPVFIQMRHSAHTHATLFSTNFFPLYCNAWFASACSENMRHGNLTLLRFDSRAWLGDRCPPNPPFTGWNGPKPDPALPPTQPTIPCTLGLYLALSQQTLIQNQLIFSNTGLGKNWALLWFTREFENISGQF